MIDEDQPLLGDTEPTPDDALDQRKAFDEERKRGIFSTDVAAILGLSRYGTALSVYNAKRGQSPVRTMSLSAWVGLRLENLVAEMYTASTGYKVRADNLAHFHKEYGWLGAHLDRRVVGDANLIVELKTRNSTRGWGEDGSAQVPPDVWCQVQAQLFVTGARECHVAAFFNSSSFRVYKLLPDPTFAEKILPKLDEFWHENVVAGVPPVPTGHEADTDIVRRWADGDGGEIKPATPEQEEVVAQYRLARFNRAQAEFAEVGLKNRLIQIIGPDADGLTGAFGRITFRRAKSSRHVNWELLAGTYRRGAERLLELFGMTEQHDSAMSAEVEMIGGQLETAETLYTEVKPGTRRFIVDWQDE